MRWWEDVGGGQVLWPFKVTVSLDKCKRIGRGVLTCVYECVGVLFDQQVLQDSALGHEAEQVVVAAEEDVQPQLHKPICHCLDAWVHQIWQTLKLV